jgi:hypothetical protein
VRLFASSKEDEDVGRKFKSSNSMELFESPLFYLYTSTVLALMEVELGRFELCRVELGLLTMVFTSTAAISMVLLRRSSPSTFRLTSGVGGVATVDGMVK